MVPFYINNLGITLELKSTLNFKRTGLLQPWQTLCKMFSRCLTTRVTGYDQPSLQIMQMLFCFVNNINVDYAELIWEGFQYSLQNLTTMIPYPRFTKLIVSHYMTAFPEISRQARDRYHILEDDVMNKSIFNSGKSKNVVGMKIPDWMITDEMKLTENYRLYAEVFRVDVPTIQSQPIESIQGTHRTTSAPRTPNFVVAEGESNTLQVSLAVQKSHEELKAKQNVEKVKEHLMAEEIEKLVKGSENIQENVEVVSSPLRNDDNQTNLDNREKGKHVEGIRNTPSPTTIRSPRIQSTLVSSDTEKLQELTKTDPTPSSSLPSSSSPKTKLSNIKRLLSLFKSKPGHIMMESLPKMVDERMKKILQTQVPLHVAQGLILEREKSQADVAKMIAEAIQQERDNLRSEISSQINDAIANHIPSMMLETYKELFELRLQELQQMFNAKTIVRKDEIGVILTDEQNDSLFADASQMEEIKELVVNPIYNDIAEGSFGVLRHNITTQA
ncbi:hypothetical protein Tco_0031895 [Tanacetum coccineum]